MNALSLLILLASLSHVPAAQANGPSAVCQAGFAALVPASKEDFIKSYMMLNLAFPQHNETISAGITSFYLGRDIPFTDIYGRFSDELWKKLFLAMNNTHAAHGISRKVSLSEMQNTLSGFITTFPRKIESTIEMVAEQKLPGNLRNSEARIAWFFTEPKMAEKAAKLRSYATTVNAAMRSPEARVLSQRFRDTISGREVPEAEKVFVGQIAGRMEEVVVAKLIAAHPELGEKVTILNGRKFDPAEIRAVLLYRAMHQR